MDKVWGKNLAVLRRLLVQLGENPATVFAQCGIPQSTIDPSEITWDQFCALVREIETRAGSAERLSELGLTLLGAPEFEPLSRTLSVVSDPYLLYWAQTRWSGIRALPVVQSTYEKNRDGSITITLTIPDHLTECPGVLHLATGLFRGFPKLLRMGEASVRATISARKGHYVIVPPQPGSLFARVSHQFSTFFSARSSLEQLAAQQATLIQQNIDLLRASSEAEMARRDAERAREAAEQALELRRAFLMTISHELRTPMNGIVGAADLLATSPGESHRVELMRELQDSAERMVTLLDNLLDFSHIEAKQIHLEMIPFEPRHEVAAVVDTHSEYAHSRSTRLTARVDPRVPDWIKGDRRRFRQVLDCLVSNAVRFTEAGDVAVTVEAHTQPDRLSTVLTVSVRDTGPGISPGEQSIIFEPFLQGDRTTTRRFGGLGLGLAVSKRIVVLTGGELTVHSEIGRGSTFNFTLPAPVCSPKVSTSSHTLRVVSVLPKPAVAETSILSAPKAPYVDAGAKLRVLVVDDNSTNRLVARRIVERIGCRVDTAENGAEAVAAVRAIAYDLVLMDCLMPVMDGLDATRSIREMEVLLNRRTPIVAITANALQADRERCLAAGMDDFLPKPIRSEGIEAALIRWGFARINSVASNDGLELFKSGL
jgi:signal transduction histidine kinase/CheY-like chemotaxis protein